MRHARQGTTCARRKRAGSFAAAASAASHACVATRPWGPSGLEQRRQRPTTPASKTIDFACPLRVDDLTLVYHSRAHQTRLISSGVTARRRWLGNRGCAVRNPTALSRCVCRARVGGWGTLSQHAWVAQVNPGASPSKPPGRRSQYQCQSDCRASCYGLIKDSTSDGVTASKMPVQFDSRWSRGATARAGGVVSPPPSASFYRVLVLTCCWP